MDKCEHDVDNFNHVCLLTGEACGYVGRIGECPLRKPPGEAEKAAKREDRKGKKEWDKRARR